jgi:uridine kinase/ribulose-5-phosphate 4-epimerase/fuculose-1-phosphate aldolase
MLNSESIFIIGITGPSGVGKTSISNLLSLQFKNECTILSGDDLHKWIRNDENWNKYTHLNPQANDLDLGYSHIKKLKNNVSIQRKKYNHNYGTFDDEITISPSKYIIYEGLHALYDEKLKDLIDCKIYIDTDSELTKEWKVKRDTSQRGYSQKQVEDIINRRNVDQEIYINPQKNNADVILRFYKNSNNEIDLDYFLINENHSQIIINLVKIYKQLQEFFNLSKLLSTEISLTQSTGGNISIKKDDKIIIKSSGHSMFNINMTKGYSVCKYEKQIPQFISEKEYDKFIDDIKINDSKPSMEIGFHLHLNKNVVVHTHPIYLNTILCSLESKEIISKLFENYNYEYIKYITPGYKLSNIIGQCEKKKIYFLENHGLIVLSDDILSGFKLTVDINETCKIWIDKHMESFVNSNINYNEDNILFPDGIILYDEMKSINDYMINLMKSCYLTPRYLTYENVNELLNLNAEKYRKNIL